MYRLQSYKFPLFATKVILIKANLKTEPHVTAYMQRLHLIELVWGLVKFRLQLCLEMPASG